MVMAYSQKTMNYDLPQWESDNKPVMEDFNEANRKIDDALSLLNTTKADSSDVEIAKKEAISQAVKQSDEKMAPTPFILPADSWEASETYPGYEYQLTLEIPGVTPADLVRADFNPATLPAAENAETMPAGDTITGGVIFYAAHQPESDLNGMYTVYKAVV